jgi:repressor LexA
LKGLTKSQARVFDFVTCFIKEKGYSPTFRDIQSHFKLASLGSVYTYVKALKSKGLFIDRKNSPIALDIKEDTLTSEHKIPFIGYLTAGFPIEMFAQSQTLGIPASLITNKESTYVLRVKGDTLLDEHICNGDHLIIEARSFAQEGELILATINGQDTLVKRFYPEGAYVRLEAQDARHEPIILSASELNIQGVVRGVLRAL